METRFAHDFSHVRVHSGEDAALSADAAGAAAYTWGNHVVFGRDQVTTDLLTHELGHVVESEGRAPSLLRAPKCKNQKEVDAVLTKNPRGYGKGVTMYTKKIEKGDTLSSFADDTVDDNDVHVKAHYSRELKALNKNIHTGKIGNCALLLKGWTDPNIGELPARPKAGSLPKDVKKAIATVYAEQTGTFSNASIQRKYVWFSMRSRLELGLHGPTLDDVVDKGGYYGKGTPDYKAARKDLDAKGGPSGAVLSAQQTVLSNWSNSIPALAGPYYFHWRKQGAAESCFKSRTAKKAKHPMAADEAEQFCAWKFAHDHGIAGSVPQSEAWHWAVAGNEPAPNDRLGSMYIYRY